MPYVTREDRAGMLQMVIPTSDSVGGLTYCFQQVLAEYLDRKLTLRGKLEYKDFAECLGALEGCKADFIERILQPYEHNKKLQNGDVWTPELIDAAYGIKDGDHEP